MTGSEAVLTLASAANISVQPDNIYSWTRSFAYNWLLRQTEPQSTLHYHALLRRLDVDKENQSPRNDFALAQRGKSMSLICITLIPLWMEPTPTAAELLHDLFQRWYRYMCC